MTSEHKIGHLLMLCGGTAEQAGREHGRCYRQSGEQYLLYTLQLDTASLRCQFADEFLHLDLLDEDRISGVYANPARFGPATLTLCREYPELLDPQYLGEGSRTVRLITELACEVFRDDLCEAIRRGILQLKRQGATKIILHFMSSTGGGCGSAASVWLMNNLRSGQPFRRKVEFGNEKSILTKYGWAASPIGHTLTLEPDQAHLVNANDFAYKLETAELEKDPDSFEIIFHFGLSNRGGVLLDTAEKVGEAMGATAHAFMAGYREFKASVVNWHQRRLYLGLDLPERIVDQVEAANGSNGTATAEASL